MGQASSAGSRVRFLAFAACGHPWVWQEAAILLSFGRETLLDGLVFGEQFVKLRRRRLGGGGGRVNHLGGRCILFTAHLDSCYGLGVAQEGL